MKVGLICIVILCLSVCAHCQIGSSQQNMDFIRRLMAARIARQMVPARRSTPAFVRPYPGMIIPPRRIPPIIRPMPGNFWNTAMMAGMLNDDGMLLFD